MNRFLMAAIGGTVAGVVLTTQIAGPLIAQENARSTSVYEQLDLFGDVFERIRSNYVEEVDEAALIEAAINGMLTSLDPHSSYLPPDDFDSMQVQTRGEFGGLGIEVTQEDGFVRVITPMDDTPAMAAGVEAGDFITHVDGESLLGLTLREAVEMMRGPVGSEIVITVVREDQDEPFDITIIRDQIKLTAVRARLEGNTAILRVSTFNDQTYPNLQDGLAELIEEVGGIENLDGVVLDLRNNPGGLLTQAIRVSDAFLEQGEIVSTRGRDPANGDRYNATAGDLIEGRPMVVLINGGSASASEIVAGALQDHRRAVIVGTNSFGKGSVQSVMPVQGEGAMRLTTSLYYTPSGRSIQALGVAPDILVEQRDPVVVEEEEGEDRPARTEASLRGAIENSSLTEEERRLLEEERAAAEATAALRNEDYQLAYAIDILAGMNALAPSTGRDAMTPAQIARLPYRPCVGVVLCTPDGRVFAGQRADRSDPAWQMPQGGIDKGETPLDAAYRELREETGVLPDHVRLIGETAGWHAYDFPPEVAAKRWNGRFRGQTQKWVRFELTAPDGVIDLNHEDVEFSDWRWMAAPDLLAAIVPFKRAIYRAVFDDFGLI